MAERLISPPARLPVQEIRTPNHRDGWYVELVRRTDPTWQANNPIKRGMPYANMVGADQRVINTYPQGLYFLKEIKPGNSADFGNTDQFVLWFWATDELAEDTYNATVDYAAENTAYPTFTRTYDVRRKDYDTLPTVTSLSTLTCLLSVNITNAGTGYTTASGTVTGGATVEFVCSGGLLVDAIVTKEGAGVTAGASITITGDGTGGAATTRIQPATALCIAQKKVELPSDNPKSHDYVQVVRVYMTLPGPTMTGTSVSEQVRGMTVTTTETTGASGTLSPSTGSGVIQSVVSPQSSNVDKKTTVSVSAGSLPSTEVIGFFAFVPLPLLLFDIVNVIFCDGGPFFTLVSRPETSGGSSVLRKHRKTITYHATQPNLDLSGSTFVAADIRYQGKVISFSYGNVLNDEITYDEDFITSSGPSACGWTEAYSFPATDPSATEFLAGAWYTRDYDVVPWGQSGFKSTLIEYYSAEGNPAI